MAERLTQRYGGHAKELLSDLVQRYTGAPPAHGQTPSMWMAHLACVRNLAEMLDFPPDPFQLRISEALVADQLLQVRRDIALLAERP